MLPSGRPNSTGFDEPATKAKAKPKALSVTEVQERIGAMIDRRVTRYASVRGEGAPVQVAASE